MRYIGGPAGLLVISLLLVGVLSAPAWAKFVPVVSVEVEKDGTAFLLLNRRKAVEFRTPNGNLSPAERAQITAGRLTALAERGIDPGAVRYKQVGQSTYVMVGDALLVVATPAEARVRRTTSRKLAETWAQTLRRLLSLPPLAASPASLIVPLGETRTVVVESLLSDRVEASISNPAAISVDGQKKPGSLVILGKMVGDADITLECGEYTSHIKVSVRKYAAYPTQGGARAIVTGWDAPAALVSRAILDAARQAISLEPGARVDSVKAASGIPGLAPGRTIRTPVLVTSSGGGNIPVRLMVNIEAENRVLPKTETSSLLYSNDPERVKKYQVLFTGRTIPQESCRLLYHHQNMMGKRIGFVIDVANPSDMPASLHVIEGVSKPMIDTVLVGYKAGLEFLENHRSSIGRVIDLQPGTRQVIVSQPLDYPCTASGLLELRQLSGEPLMVRVTAKPEELRRNGDHPGIPSVAAVADPVSIPISDQVYPNPLKNLEATYTAGKQWVFLRIGHAALKHATKEKWLYGNYGVTYDIKAVLNNPLPSPYSVELAFEATAGEVGGIFFVDGHMVRIKSLKSPSEARISKVTIPPGATRTISVRTMPLSGSAYPATLIIRPVGTMSSISQAK